MIDEATRLYNKVQAEATRLYNAEQAEATRLYNKVQAEAARAYIAREKESARAYIAQQKEAARAYNAQQAAYVDEDYTRQRTADDCRRRANRENAQKRAQEEDARRAYEQRRHTMETESRGGGDNWAETLILQCGYRAAAMANHPDRGGSHEKMIAINNAKDSLKAQGKL